MQDTNLTCLPEPQKKHLLESTLAAMEVVVLSISKFELYVPGPDSEESKVVCRSSEYFSSRR